MSDSEEENFCFYGKPLEPYDEDAFPRKKPISVEEQIATDDHGRRRFHGAFTGGFSAGFFNTVGSLEGWTPSEFKSTRQEKAKGVVQRPEDFMDDEDMGEYGIAPQVVRATSDYSTSKKRRKQVFLDGPIPGDPVLHTLLTSGNETVGYLLLKNIGIQDKIEQHKELYQSETKVYGCEMPKSYEISKDIENKQYVIPLIYKEFLSKPKSNTFGLGYEGLDKSNINLFQSSNLVVSGKNNKKLSIKGQAFGVGAFEDDDDDIYMKEDMSKFDFELTSEKTTNKSNVSGKTLIFDKFVHSKTPLINKKLYLPPTIPHSFTGKHKVKKSRFEPLPEETETVDRREINPAIRARYLGEVSNKTYTASKPIIESKEPKKHDESKKETLNEEKIDTERQSDFDSELSNRFVSASEKEDISNILEPVKKMDTLHGTEQMRDAARMKMFGPLTRITTDWTPCSLLCKRFNVPEPFSDRPQETRKRTKNLIFEYQKHTEDSLDLKPGLSVTKNESLEESVNSTSEENVDEIIKTEIESSVSNETHNKNPDTNNTIDIEAADNLPKDITEKVNLEQKLDLFKAVFLSSSESEDEGEKEEDNTERNEELKTSVLSDQLIPKIKPIKEGILSNVNFEAFTKRLTVSSEKDDDEQGPSNVSKTEQLRVKEEMSDVVNFYGPRVPKIPLQKVVPVIKVESDDSEDEWIEKGSKEKKKKKHKEKRNKKTKHKKHKHEKNKKYKD